MVNMLRYHGSSLQGLWLHRYPGSPGWPYLESYCSLSCPSQGDEALDGGFNHDPGTEWLGEEGISATH